MFRTLMTVGLIAMSVGESIAEEKDLKKTNENDVKKVEEFLGKLAQGNEGSGEVTSANYDTGSGEIKIGAKIRCRHTAGGVYNPISRKRATIVVYDYDITGDFTLNYKTGKTTGKVKIGGAKVVEFELGAVAEMLKNVVK